MARANLKFNIGFTEEDFTQLIWLLDGDEEFLDEDLLDDIRARLFHMRHKLRIAIANSKKNSGNRK